MFRRPPRHAKREIFLVFRRTVHRIGSPANVNGGPLASGKPYLMGLIDLFRGELLEIIEWVDDSRDTLAWRFPDDDKAIKNGAQLIVRESQVAQLVMTGQFADTFWQGKHTLSTPNVPVLARIQGWKYGFVSPFKVDVYFVSTRLFTGNKWGTSNPVMMRDQDFGVVRLRAFGTFDFKVVNPQLFLKEVVGTDQNFRIDEFADTMRSRVVSVFSDALATSKIPALDVASRYGELGDALLPAINPQTIGKYGLEVTSFILENVSLPPEVEQAIDKRSGMGVIGNLNDYVKYQMGQGMAQGGGAAGAPAEMAMGFAMAQQMMRDMGSQAPSTGSAPPPLPVTAGAATSEVLTPEQVAERLGVAVPDVLAAVESGELKGRKIGTQVRITKAALEDFLAH
jgi:excisionase family DNA binding protein